ncbi:hypothetical protein EIN_047710 [Entamoeba invadens IP1]|uniref:Uncharacterized protein n=1 Tax=Entamoeba invadens IP1 TaxID=370355 RepID=A0A0A1UDE9_ENTIV|nr:hypothetical protein EIN_047710 [Entamoeba invadens IP1]ELP94468.1 hypothetical protein EIN_047710 [Entamoeba invadens IP1]|eukprot:XP_004261239.1 hypothetical protein EIN_047710 [Entamoeba invadens IP1]
MTEQKDILEAKTNEKNIEPQSSESSDSGEMVVGECTKGRSLLDGEDSDDNYPSNETTTYRSFTAQTAEPLKSPQDNQAVVDQCKVRYEGKIKENESWDWKNEKFSDEEEIELGDYEKLHFGDELSDSENGEDEKLENKEEKDTNDAVEEDHSSMINTQAIDKFLNDDSFEECHKMDG